MAQLVSRFVRSEGRIRTVLGYVALLALPPLLAVIVLASKFSGLQTPDAFDRAPLARHLAAGDGSVGMDGEGDGGTFGGFDGAGARGFLSARLKTSVGRILTGEVNGLDEGLGDDLDGEQRGAGIIDPDAVLETGLDGIDGGGEVIRVDGTEGLDATTLTLEITETALMHDTTTTSARLCELRALGARIALDDFGTGYSSLSHLRNFPIDVLKVDKSFIDDIASGSEKANLARGIIELGRTMNLDIVAEGM